MMSGKKRERHFTQYHTFLGKGALGAGEITGGGATGAAYAGRLRKHKEHESEYSC